MIRAPYYQTFHTSTNAKIQRKVYPFKRETESAFCHRNFKKKKKTKNKMVIRNHVDEDGTTTHRKKLRHNHEDYALFDRLVFHWRRQYIALFHGVLLFF